MPQLNEDLSTIEEMHPEEFEAIVERMAGEHDPAPIEEGGPTFADVDGDEEGGNS